MSTITQKQHQKIADYLDTHELTSGLGTRERACSIAAINLALTGELTGHIPVCMSPVIGRWIIRIQDAMPHEMRNSTEWKKLLPLAAGTGRNHEKERLDVIMDWMWGILPTVQPVADVGGFGAEWQAMCDKHTYAAAAAAASYHAADAGAAAAAAAAAYASYAAARAADAAAAAAAATYPDAAYAAADAAAYAAASAAADAADADAATYASDAATYAADAATYAAAAAASSCRAASYHAYHAADAAAWQTINPAALLAQLIQIGTQP